jgi:hypothetical protein
MAMGNLFRTFPSDFPGYVVVSLGNTAVWTTVGAIVMMVGRVGVLAVRRLTTRWSKREEG